jgi:hypothetical protein
MNESIRGSVPAVWHVSLEMDIDHVWDSFYIYSLLLDHAECDAVLHLDHNAASQAKCIRPALQLITTESGVEDKKNGAMLASCAHGHM